MSHGKMNPEVFKIKTLPSKNISFFLTEVNAKKRCVTTLNPFNSKG